MRLLAALLLFHAVALAQEPGEEDEKDPAIDSALEEYAENAPPPRAPASEDAGLLVEWRNAPVFESADGRFRVRLRARVLADFYSASSSDYSGPVTEDGTFIRQARLGVMGHLYTNAIYMLEYQFTEGKALPADVFVGLRNLGVFGQIQAGHLREPFSLDGVTPIPFHTFLERAEPARAFAIPRNLGIRLNDAILDRRLTWWIGVYRETDVDGSLAGDDGYSVTGRVTYLAVRAVDRLLHVGFSASFRRPVDDMARYQTRAGPVAIGPALIDTGPFAADRELRFAWEAALRLHSFVVQAELFLVEDSGLGTDVSFHGWYVQVSYWLTDEIPRYSQRGATWGRVQPVRNFHDGEGGAGAWMLALRFDDTDLNDNAIQGGEMQALAFGVTWMWNPNMRVKFNLVYADIVGGPLGSGDIIYFVMRFQVDF